MPDISGLEIQERLVREPIAPPLIFVTSHADLPSVVRAKRQGAVDFLQKQTYSENELWESIHKALAAIGTTERSTSGKNRSTPTWQPSVIPSGRFLTCFWPATATSALPTR